MNDAPLTSTVPRGGGVTSTSVKASAGTSMSPMVGVIVAAVSSTVVVVRSAAVGASLVGTISIVPFAGSEVSVLSEAVYVKVTVPLKFAGGA